MMVLSAASIVFVMGLILDIGAVARVLWAALSGRFGTWSRFAALVILLVLVCVTALMLYQPAPPPPAKVRKKASRPAMRTEAPGGRNAAKDISPTETAPVAIRRGKRTKSTPADRP